MVMLLVVGSTCLQLPYNVVSEDAALMMHRSYVLLSNPSLLDRSPYHTEWILIQPSWPQCGEEYTAIKVLDSLPLGIMITMKVCFVIRASKT